ncbi:MAG: hypothetical protein HXO22_02005 [Prevotella sp.]|nr:hypothetical protein [Prevotella sp.]MBF1584529.1 hypothetical protein [Prevotella sp.]
MPHRKTGCPYDCDTHQEPMCHACAMHSQQRRHHHGFRAVQPQLPHTPQTVAQQAAWLLNEATAVSPYDTDYLIA